MSAHPAGLSTLSVKKMTLKDFGKAGLYHHQIDRFKQDKRTLNVEKAVQRVRRSAPLCSLQELGTLDFKEEFIILKGENPVKAEKALYFLDPYFMDRLMMVSPKLTELTASLNKTKSIGC